MNERFKQHDPNARIRASRRTLLVEILFTLVIATAIVWVSFSNLEQQARTFAASANNDYNLLMEQYTRSFDTAYLQIVDKIIEDPSFDEMDAWLKSMDARWSRTMGANIYDGISLTYKGGFARSWSYGDYSDYDPTTRPWYQAAQDARGKTALLAPYVTFLDSQFSADSSYIVMSIVKKYSNDICIDYDLKLPEVRDLMLNRNNQYTGSTFLLFDPDGYILSSSDDAMYTHNLNTPDDEISAELCDALLGGRDQLGTLHFALIDGSATYVYVNQDDSGNYLAVLVPFASVFVRDYLLITVLALLLVGFEVLIFFRNRTFFTEFRNRDARLKALTDAFFQDRLFVDRDTQTFYGSEEAAQMCPDPSYEAIFAIFCQRIEDTEQQQLFFDFVSPGALAEAYNNKNKLATQRFPMRWRMPDGTYQSRVIEVSRLTSVIDGRETAAILCRDVTENAQILKEALKQAQSASQAKGDFMSRMSHEIRTPLNAVIGYLDIAHSDRSDADKIAHCIEQAQLASRHLLNIINDVLDISSIESGRMKIAHDEFDLTQTIKSLTTIFYAQAQQKGVRFEVNVSELTEERVCGDSLRVNQILVNLLGNAMKFTPKEGLVRLDIRQVGVRDNKVFVQFKVSDTGIGISKEFQERLFNPFEQESASTARNYGGTGLGLSISSNLVKMMGGSIEVESTPGEGTTFSVSLVFDRVEQQGGHTADASPENFSNLRALVVDDEDSTCEYVQSILARCGVACDGVTSGKKALRRVTSRLEAGKPYDFCILDWNMPNMDGLQTARAIREACGDDLPIIIATAYDYSAIVDEAHESGVNSIVSKPLFQSTVFDMLVNTFGKYDPSAPKAKGELDEEVDFKGMRVLLVEDNAMNMEIARDILSKAGMEVTPAVNGKEALDAFTQSPQGTFDAILMDVQMPVMDGYEATRAIRKSSHPQATSIPIVAMTANAFTSDVTEALAAGMNDHVAKPISYKKLFATLSRLTQRG